MKLTYPRKKYLQKSIVEEFILENYRMRDIMSVVNQVARYDVNVLLVGESGTGKEMLAKIIHLQSRRAQHPFVPINCGVLSGLMFEDKLFGHEKGAFTGAIDQKIGSFEMADGGTLFLDEVSELPLDNQVDFLRVLEDFQFSRIGGSETIKVDVRIISATNKDLKTAIREGRFREDLFFRLHVVPIYLPPLRERKDCIPQMVDYFLDQFELTYKKNKPQLHRGVFDLFFGYEWPGNVRELKNLLERVFITTDAAVIQADDLPSDFLRGLENPERETDLAKVRREAESRVILDVLYRVRGDRKKASRMLGISPRTLRHKMRTYDLRWRKDDSGRSCADGRSDPRETSR